MKVGAAGDSLSVYISDNDPTNAWHLDVYADVGGGQALVGRVTTTPYGAGTPAVGGRIVAVACVPGALRWWVRSTRSAGPGGGQISCSVSPYPCAPAGVTAV